MSSSAVDGSTGACRGSNSKVTVVDNDVELRPVAEVDLPIIYRLTNDPGATGDFEWYGWHDPWRFRRRWEESGTRASCAARRIPGRPVA